VHILKNLTYRTKHQYKNKNLQGCKNMNGLENYTCKTSKTRKQKCRCMFLCFQQTRHMLHNDNLSFSSVLARADRARVDLTSNFIISL
jgi:hypothetical protein